MKVEGSELAAVIAGADAARAAFRTEFDDGGETGAHGIGNGGFGEPVDDDFKDAIEIVIEIGRDLTTQRWAEGVVGRSVQHLVA